MSDAPQGPGWWEASDGKWYAPELHPDHRPPTPPPSFEPPAAGPPPSYEPPAAGPPPSFEPPAAGPPSSYEPPPHFEPPRAEQRVPDPSHPPPGGSPPPAPGAPHGGSLYPSVPARPRRSTGKILAIVFGSIFLLAAVGCGAFLWAFRDEIVDATVDFSNAEVVTDVATCTVTGIDIAEDYGIEATLTASTASVRSHYRLDYRLVDPGGATLGQDFTVFRNMEPGETRTESVFNTIDASVPVDQVDCAIVTVLRVDA